MSYYAKRDALAKHLAEFDRQHVHTFADGRWEISDGEEASRWSDELKKKYQEEAERFITIRDFFEEWDG